MPDLNGRPVGLFLRSPGWVVDAVGGKGTPKIRPSRFLDTQHCCVVSVVCDLQVLLRMFSLPGPAVILVELERTDRKSVV